MIFSPVEISGESAEEISEVLNKHSGIQVHHFNSLVDYSYNAITKYKRDNRDKPLIASELKEEIDNQLSNYVDVKKQHYLERIEQIKELIGDEKQKDEYIRKYEHLIDYLNNISNNKEGIIDEALKKTNLKEVSTPDKFEENQSEENQKEKNYSQNALEEGGKNSISAEVRELLTGIKEVDKDFNTMTDFLGLPSVIPVDTTVEILQQILSNAGGSKKVQLATLNQYVKAFPFLQEVIDKFNAEPEKVQNQFLSFFDKSKLNMKFVMFSIDSKGKPHVKVMNSNSSEVANIILKRFENNLKDSSLIERDDNGVYTYNINEVDRVIKRLNNIYEKPGGKIVRKRTQAKIDDFDKDIKNQNLASLQKAGIQLTEGSTFIKDNKVYSIVNDKVKETPSALSLYDRLGKKIDLDNSIKELQSVLEEVGIVLSSDNIKNIIDNGIYINSENSRKTFQESFGQASPLSLIKIIKDKLSSINKDNNLVEDNNILKETILKNYAIEEALFANTISPTSFRVAKKTLQTHINKTYIKEREQELKNDPFLRKQLLQQAFSKHSMLLELLENTKLRNTFSIDYLSLESIKQRKQKAYQGTKLQDLSEADHEMVKLGLYTDMKQGAFKGQNYQGVLLRTATYLGLTNSDKSNINTISMPTLDFRKADDFILKEDGDVVPGENMINILYEQTVLPEFERITNFLNEKIGSNIKGYNKGAGSFLMFPNLNSLIIDYKGKKKTLTELANDIEGFPKLMQQYLNNDKENLKNTNPDEFNFLENFEKEVKNYLTKTVGIQYKQKLNDWETYNIVESSPLGELKVYDNKLLDVDYLNKFNSIDPNLSDNNKIIYSAMEFVVNNMISNSNQFMLLAGDPAMYYSNKSKSDNFADISKNTAENINKRLAAMIAPGNKLADSEEEQYIQIFVNDLKGPANNLASLTKLLDNKTFDQNEYDRVKNDPKQLDSFINKYPNTKPFFNIESTDAQEYTTWKEHVHVLEKLGKANPGLIDSARLENAIELVESGKALKDMNAEEKELIAFVYQPMKPVYTGQIIEGTQDNPLFRTVYIKSSSIPLLPQITEGRQLDVVRQAMEKLEAKSGGKKVRLSYNTANKVGANSNSATIFDDNGNIMQNDVDTLVKEFENSSVLLDRKNFRIQQEVPYKGKKDTVSQGTQTTKLLFGNGVTSMKGFQYKGESFDGSALERKFFDNFSDLLDLEKETLYDELGIDVKTGIPKDIEKTANKLKKLLKEEAEERNYEQQVVDSLEIDYTYAKDGSGKITGYQFKLPLWLSPSSNNLEALLNSVVSNRIAKLKFPGNTFVVSSPEGYKQVTEVSEDIENQIIYLDENFDGDLKGIQINKDGSIVHKTQVYLPSRFKDSKGNLIDLFDGYVELKNDKYVLKKDKFDKELLSNISFRTPTSSHQSMLDVEIVGFLPPKAGDLMVVPRNTLTQVGLDFDIDKQTNYSLYHYVDKNGNIKVISDNVEKIQSELDSKTPKSPERIKELKDRLKKIYKNNIVKIHSSVLSNPKMQSKISKALSMEWEKGQAQKIDDLVTFANADDINTGESFTMLSDSYQKNLVKLGASGKVGIGAYSIDVVFHSLLNQNSIATSQNSFGSITSNKFYGDLKTAGPNQRDISDVLTARQNLATDNAKEQALEKLFLNKETFDVDKVMTLMGFDKDENGNSIVGLFLNQPIIRDYVNTLMNLNSIIAPYVEDKQAEALKIVYDKYIGDDSDTLLILSQFDLKNALMPEDAALIKRAIDNEFKEINGK